jgi:hypothetical protein
MNADKQPAPSPTIRKANGTRIFHVYPGGIELEAGPYETEAAAKEARLAVLIRWGSNGEKYGSLAGITGITRQTFPVAR